MFLPYIYWLYPSFYLYLYNIRHYKKQYKQKSTLRTNKPYKTETNAVNPIKSSKDLVIGYYYQSNPKIRIVTSWTGGSNYETYVESPFFQDGEGKYVAKYGKDQQRAVDGHLLYVITYANTDRATAIKSLGPKPYQTKAEESKPVEIKISEEDLPTDVKISFSALIRIFYQLADKNSPLLISPSGIPDCFYLQIKDGEYGGGCYFDTIESETHEFRGVWANILANAKNDIKKRDKSKLKSLEHTNV